MRKAGATSSSFDTIVASGDRSALPHGVASDKVIEKGDFVTLDFGAYYNGYFSDITRTVAVGEPDDEIEGNLLYCSRSAAYVGMHGIKPGMTGKEADALTRDYITEKGYGEYFGHSTGHGIGLEVHEGPALSLRSDTFLNQEWLSHVNLEFMFQVLVAFELKMILSLRKNGNESLTHSKRTNYFVIIFRRIFYDFS